MSRRVAAAIALLALVAGAVLLAYSAIREFPQGLVVLALLVAAGAVAWQGVTRGGRARLTSTVVAGLLVLAGVGILVADGVLSLIHISEPTRPY